MNTSQAPQVALTVRVSIDVEYADVEAEPQHRRHRQHAQLNDDLAVTTDNPTSLHNGDTALDDEPSSRCIQCLLDKRACGPHDSTTPCDNCASRGLVCDPIPVGLISIYDSLRELDHLRELVFRPAPLAVKRAFAAYVPLHLHLAAPAEERPHVVESLHPLEHRVAELDDLEFLDLGHGRLIHAANGHVCMNCILAVAYGEDPPVCFTPFTGGGLSVEQVPGQASKHKRSSMCHDCFGKRYNCVLASCGPHLTRSWNLLKIAAAIAYGKPDFSLRGFSDAVHVLNNSIKMCKACVRVNSVNQFTSWACQHYPRLGELIMSLFGTLRQQKLSTTRPKFRRIVKNVVRDRGLEALERLANILRLAGYAIRLREIVRGEQQRQDMQVDTPDGNPFPDADELDLATFFANAED